ncbi:cohesin complex subunit [Eremomyces bilateralis CBS 781.70]|uniref:Structural maintenance of chromosomes protein n=1 Tax=Eremomyces bilateralis CBS 781.70 TaxID=1392243 RepID=A0A6G1GCG4_9PEZI|nr:cohesin complex subunit [Eremomyces bilateralis CBS 781.70]KAF1815777.1 cohesin complex subunit [Eremomyces bilateralis CBS 781.70]
MGKLIRLELFNFKSYKGHHVMLFGDSYFTSIIGPNGSGKSNSMDAISFVLGIKSSHLRSTHLKDLIYRGRVLKHATINADGTATAPETNGAQTNGHTNGDVDGEQLTEGSQRNDPTSAWVMAVYEDDAGEEQRWKRSITSQGQSEYRINNRVVTAKQYNEALETENILIKARNFLVFQGDVEAIANQNPRDLTRLIEQISGSLEYKADYERLKADAYKAAEEQGYMLHTRRGINSEIRQWQKEKQEADEFAKKASDRDEAVVQHILWKLFHYQRVIDESTEEIQRQQEELKEFRRKNQSFEESLETARREQARASREVSKIEKEIKKAEKDIEGKRNDLVPIDEKISISTRQLDSYKTRIEEVSKQRDNRAQRVDHMTKQLETVQKSQKKWEEEWQATQQQQGRQLSSDDLKQYNQIRGDVTKRTAEAQTQVDIITRQIKTDEETLNSLRGKVEQLEGQVGRFESEIDDLKTRHHDLASQAKTAQRDIDGKKKQYNNLSSERVRSANLQTELEEKLQGILRRLADADYGKHESEKEARAKQIVADLKRIFPGVRGRLHELCRPKQKKYETAMASVLGRHFGSVVVDTEKTARDCIAHLREQRLGQATFLPLDSITVHTVNPGLKGMHKKMRLAIDTIEYDHKNERAMMYGCGNAMVCDDLDTARYLCFDKRVDAKAVTLDGTVIHKGGLMTGGRGPQDRNAKRWEEADLENLRMTKDKILADIASLPKPRRSEEEQISNELSSLEHRLEYLNGETKAYKRNIASKEKELADAKHRLKETRPKFQAQDTSVSNLKARLQQHQDKISAVEDELFAAFCQRLGFDNIRVYEAQQGTLQQEAAQKNFEYSTQRTRLENQLQFETVDLQSLDERVKNLHASLSRDENLIAEFEHAKAQVDKEIRALQKARDKLGKQMASLKETQAEKVREAARARAELAEQTKSVELTLKRVADLEAEIQRNASGRYALLRKCKIDEVRLPLEEGSMPLESLPLDDILQAGGGAVEDEDEMDIDEGNGARDGEVGLGAEIRDYGIEIDFDELDEDLQEDDSPKTEQSLLDKIKSMSTELDKMAPNMRATDRLEEVESRLKSTEKDFESARRAAKRAKDDFEDVKDRRLELFNRAFSHISDQIGPVYKELTRSQALPLGGQAYLDTEDPEEPYLQGIKYHAMPPLKRFRDMEQLSGGEKTMAAMALLFSIHSFQPSPFFVLDEVDAALDNANVAKISKYIRDHAGPGMQFIVISLKAGLFQESEALVGVMRDQGVNSSRALTLDLRKYTS